MVDFAAVRSNVFYEELKATYKDQYGVLDPEAINIVVWAARMSMDYFSNSDSLYHDMEHTMLVTLVGQDILIGKNHEGGGVSTNDWMQYMLALLFHDIGYIHGVCSADTDTTATTGVDGDMVSFDRDGTNAQLSPYHVDRSKLFVKERFSGIKHINADLICEYIECTRFPAPAKEVSSDDSYPNLARAADLIGQLGDPYYLRKIPCLFYEFKEIGLDVKLGYKHPGDFKKNYASFYWKEIAPHITSAIEYLKHSQRGRKWISNLQGHVFTSEYLL